MPLQRSVAEAHLYEPEDGEGRSAVVSEQEADDAEELSVKAAVTQTEQEAAEQGQPDAEQRQELQSETKYKRFLSTLPQADKDNERNDLEKCFSFSSLTHLQHRGIMEELLLSSHWFFVRFVFTYTKIFPVFIPQRVKLNNTNNSQI